MLKERTKKQIEEVAQDCLDCKLCLKECTMLNEYTNSPKKLFEDYHQKGYENMDKNIAYSCNFCYQCTLKCPKKFDFRDIFLGMREGYVQSNKGKSPIKGHKAVAVHQYLSYKNIFNTEIEKSKKTKYVFYPGCSLSAYSPEKVGKILDFLNEKLDNEVGAVLKCCGKPLKAMGRTEDFKEKLKLSLDIFDNMECEKIIVACQNCYMIFKEYANQEVVSLWELFPEIGIPEGQKGIGSTSDVVFNIHDSCPTRDITSIHDGIRWTMRELGYRYEEMEHYGKNTRCCGLGGMVGAGVPNIAKKIIDNRASECTTGHILSYCGACREAMENAGLDSLHMIDLVFDDVYTEEKAKKRNKSPLEQWKNRYRTKKELNKRRK